MTLPCLLAVDDEPDNLSGIRRTLRGRCEVITCSTASDALKVIQEREVHLVISDLRMPEMNGVELLEQIRLLSPRTQRIILSAYSDASELLDAINRGSVLRYVLKPISPEKLRQVVGDVLAGIAPPAHEQVVLAVGDELRAPLAEACARISAPVADWTGEEPPGTLVVLDLDREDVDGAALLARLSRGGGELILATSGERFEEGLTLVRRGAVAILRKPLAVDEAHRVLERALHRRRLAIELESLKQEQPSGPFSQIVGSSPVMRRLVTALSSIAQIDSTVLLRGETGTGKEVVAQAIHAASARRGGPFVAVHCAALSGTLLESELFGHERGSFTGATERRVGRFERAHSGTLFLDEVGDIPLDTQIKLLRVLQERVIERVGGREQIPIDVRVIAATHRDLESMIAAGQFREDLYYRLKVIPITLPPLRERREDVRELALRFLDLHQRAMKKDGVTLPPEVLRLLEERPWPGNVRELRNELERLVAFTPDRTPVDATLLSDGDSVPPVTAGPTASITYDESGTIHDIMERIEAQVVRAFLERHGWNQTNAAQRLGVTRQALAKKLQKFGITIPRNAPGE